LSAKSILQAPTKPTWATQMRKTSSPFTLSSPSRIFRRSLSSPSPDWRTYKLRDRIFLFDRQPVEEAFISFATPIMDLDLLHHIRSLQRALLDKTGRPFERCEVLGRVL